MKASGKMENTPNSLTDRFLLYLSKTKNPTLDKISEDLEISELEVRGLISTLPDLSVNKNGKIIKTPVISEPSLYKVPSDLDHLRLLLISDTHLGSKYARPDILNYLYDKAEVTNTNYILHSGDLTEGLSGRPEQIHELLFASYTEQRDYVIDKYPKSDIPTYLISGNHDKWWVKQCGSDICKDISQRRPDIIYLGSDCEDISIGSLRIRLYHGKGGSSYARSYKLQKYLDSIPPKNLPHILQTGHIHTAFYMKQFDTHCFQTGCLEDLTPYARSLGYSSEKSCWWVDVYFDSKGRLHRIAQEIEMFGDKKKKVLSCRK